MLLSARSSCLANAAVPCEVRAMNFRRAILWLHRWAGLLAGLIKIASMRHQNFLSVMRNQVDSSQGVPRSDCEKILDALPAVEVSAGN